MRKLDLSRATKVFGGAAAFSALFAAVNQALVSLTDYRLYIFGAFGTDLVWLSVMGLSAVLVLWLCRTVKNSVMGNILKVIIIVSLLFVLHFVIYIELFAFEFRNVSLGDRYEFTSPDGRRTLLVYEVPDFIDPDDGSIYAYEKRGAFAVRTLGGYNGFKDTDVWAYMENNRPCGNYSVDWSGDVPVLTPVDRKRD